MPPPQRLALTMRPPSPTVGSFAFAVKDYPDSISIMSNRYSKAPILDRMNLTEDDICLAAYLSDKGAAACPHSRVQGHERADSPAHVFSEALLALRPIFEQPPFKLNRNALLSRRPTERPSSRSSRPLQIQYHPPVSEPPRPPLPPPSRSAPSQPRQAQAPVAAPPASRPAPSRPSPPQGASSGSGSH